MAAEVTRLKLAFCNLNSEFCIQKIPSREFAAEANRLFGDQTYYATVDTSLPERKMKAWEKKTTNGDDE